VSRVYLSKMAYTSLGGAKAKKPKTYKYSPTFALTKNARTKKGFTGGMNRSMYIQRKRVRYAHRAGKAGMMSCTKKYAASLLDPSGDLSRGACVPFGFPMPSQKARSWIRGTFSTGTTGSGFILYTPTIANDATCITYTAATSVGTNATILSSFTNIGSANQTKLPYSTAEIAVSNSVEGRFVSGGLKVRYIGPQNSCGGYSLAIEDPDHVTLAGQTGNQLLQFEAANLRQNSTDGQWHIINWTGPVKQAESEYVTTPTYSTQSSLGIYIDGTFQSGAGGQALPGPSLFEYEAWTNVEYVGRDTTGKTDNEADPQGASTAVSIIKSVQATSGVSAGDEKSKPIIAAKMYDLNPVPKYIIGPDDRPIFINGGGPPLPLKSTSPTWRERLYNKTRISDNTRAIVGGVSDAVTGLALSNTWGFNPAGHRVGDTWRDVLPYTNVFGTNYG